VRILLPQLFTTRAARRRGMLQALHAPLQKFPAAVKRSQDFPGNNANLRRTARGLQMLADFALGLAGVDCRQLGKADPRPGTPISRASVPAVNR
jgi:hypothetical protein